MTIYLYILLFCKYNSFFFKCEFLMTLNGTILPPPPSLHTSTVVNTDWGAASHVPLFSFSNADPST